MCVYAPVAAVIILQVLPGVLSSFQPQLVLYDAGVDVHVLDDLGRLAVTDQGAFAVCACLFSCLSTHLLFMQLELFSTSRASPAFAFLS